MSKGKVLMAAPVHLVLADGLVSAGYECVWAQQITQAAAYELIKDCVGVVTSTRLQLDKDLIDAAPLLKWIGRMGSGMEVIDTGYATQRGVACFSSPEGNSNAVGEHALGMLLSLIRHISWSQQEIKQGLWLREENRGIELEGKTVAIIGYGHTGAAFAKKLQGFDMEIIAYDKYTPGNIPSHVKNCSLADIYNNADIVSFHVPFQKDTIHYFDKDFIGNMRKPFILLNTSRGAVVSPQALLEGLQSGKVTGACLDVWEEEPLAKMGGETLDIFKVIARMSQVIVTPHIAGYTFEALYKMSKILLYKIIND